MKKMFYALIIVLCSVTAFSQSYTERVLILNEGYFDYFTGEIITPVSVGEYNPQTGIYTTLNEIAGARFASDIIIDGGFYYVAADKFLNQYDLFTDELLNSIEIPGIRKIAVDNDYIVVTRGEYLVSFDSYIQAYNKSTFDLSFEISNAELNYTTEGVIINDGIAYVAVNNGFNFGSEVGMIAEVNLTSHTLSNLVDLGADGINPDNLMFDGNTIYTLNNKDFTGSSISSYKIISGDLNTTNLINISSGCGTSVFAAGDIYYQEMFGTTLSKFNPATAEITSETDYGISFYGLAIDEINNLTYTSETDYFSYGKVNVFNEDGILVNTFDVGVSPGNFAFDVRMETAIEDVNTIAINIYPNPATENLQVSAESAIRQITVADLSGQILVDINNINSATFTVDLNAIVNAGNYMVTVTTDKGVNTKLISKY